MGSSRFWLRAVGLATALVAGDGGQKLDVYPPGKPDYASELPPKGAELVEVQGEYTGHIPGAQLVCRLVPQSAAASEGQPGWFCLDPSARRRPAKGRLNSRLTSWRSTIPCLSG